MASSDLQKCQTLGDAWNSSTDWLSVDSLTLMSSIKIQELSCGYRRHGIHK